MACADLEQLLQHQRTGHAAHDQIKQVLSDCHQLCDYVDGKESFGLAGPGVFLSFAIQALLTVLLGTLQSFISYITPPHASSSTRLSLGRVQIVFDTVCSTGIFLYFITLTTSFIRLRKDPSAFECIMIQRLLDGFSTLMNTTLVTRIVQRQPTKVKLPPQRWNLWQIWSLATVLPFLGQYLNSMSARTPSVVLSRLCAAIDAEKYSSGTSAHPTGYVPLSGNSFLLFGITVCVISIIGCIVIDTLCNWFWTWLRTIFTSRITLILAVSFWALIALTGLGLNSWQLIRLQSAMSNSGLRGEWDFGQVVAVGLWIPALYQLLLTCLVCLNLKSRFNPDLAFGPAVNNMLSFLIIELYESNVGEAPRIEKDTEENKGTGEKSGRDIAEATTPELEKADLAAASEKPAVPGTETADQQTHTKQDETSTVENVSDALAEKAPLMQDHET